MEVVLHALTLERVGAWVFDIGAFTNLTRITGLPQDMEGAYGEAKAELFRRCGNASSMPTTLVFPDGARCRDVLALPLPTNRGCTPGCGAKADGVEFRRF